MKTIRFGLNGCGRISKNHFEAIRMSLTPLENKDRK